MEFNKFISTYKLLPEISLELIDYIYGHKSIYTIPNYLRICPSSFNIIKNKDFRILRMDNPVLNICSLIQENTKN